MKRILIGLSLFAMLLIAAYMYSPWWPIPAKERTGYCRIGDIAAPEGYVRMAGNDPACAEYLRRLPLEHPDSLVRRWDGVLSDTVSRYSYQRLSLPLLSRYEQCADVSIRLRAGYLFSQRRFFDIHFDDTQYHTIYYRRGNRKYWLYEYLKEVYKVANTTSLMRETQPRPVTEVQPGDVWIYDAESRPEANFGHAITVADVAIDTLTGQRAVLLVQGSTPACHIHLMRNVLDTVASPWFVLNAAADTIDFGFARYHRSELRYFD